MFFSNNTLFKEYKIVILELTISDEEKHRIDLNRWGRLCVIVDNNI